MGPGYHLGRHAALAAIVGGVAFALGFSLTGLNQLWASRKSGGRLADPTVPSAPRQLAVFACPLVLVLLAGAYEAYAQGVHKVLRDSNTPEEKLRVIFDSSWRHLDPRLNRWLAANRNLPPDILQQLASSSLKGTRAHVAWNPRTPTEVVWALSRDASELVRREAARNQNAPLDLLEAQSRDTEVSVRMAVARHRSSTPDILAHLAADPSPHVRYLVAENPKAPVEALWKLAGDKEEANPAYPYLRRPRKISECLRQRVNSAVAANPSTPTDLLVHLSRGESCSARYRVATNAATPQATLRELGNDPETSVRYAAQRTLKTSTQKESD